MFCKKCGKENADGSKFCSGCGLSFEESTSNMSIQQTTAKPKKKNGCLTAIIIAVGIIVVLVVIGSLAGKGGNTNQSSNQPANKEGKQTETESKPTITKEGVSSDVKIVVEGMESKSTIGDNQFSKKDAQGVFKIVKITLTNNQKDAVTIDSNSFKLMDDKGREFSYSTDGQMALATSVKDKKESFFLKSVNPGISITGYIVFDIPKDATGLYLKARGGMLGKEIKLKVE